MDISGLLMTVLDSGGSSLHVTVGRPPVMPLGRKPASLDGLVPFAKGADVSPPRRQQVRPQLSGTPQGIISQRLLPMTEGTGWVPAAEPHGCGRIGNETTLDQAVDMSVVKTLLGRLGS